MINRSHSRLGFIIIKNRNSKLNPSYTGSCIKAKQADDNFNQGEKIGRSLNKNPISIMACASK